MSKRNIAYRVVITRDNVYIVPQCIMERGEIEMSEQNIEARLLAIERRLAVVDLALKVSYKAMESHQAVIEDLFQKIQELMKK